MSDTPSLPGIIGGAIQQALAQARVALPGRVVSYDAAHQSCSVQPLIHDGYMLDGERQTARLAVVTRVPIVFPGGGAYSLTWPVKPGDTVLLVFASKSLDRWLALGGEVDPADDRTLHLTDAIAIPGLRSFATPVPAGGVSNDAAVMRCPAFRIGDADADDPVLRRSDMRGLRAALMSAAIGVGVGGASGVVAAMDTTPDPAPGTPGADGVWPVGSSIVKVSS